MEVVYKDKIMNILIYTNILKIVLSEHILCTFIPTFKHFNIFELISTDQVLKFVQIC